MIKPIVAQTCNTQQCDNSRYDSRHYWANFCNTNDMRDGCGIFVVWNGRKVAEWFTYREADHIFEISANGYTYIEKVKACPVDTIKHIDCYCKKDYPNLQICNDHVVIRVPA